MSHFSPISHFQTKNFSERKQKIRKFLNTLIFRITLLTASLGMGFGYLFFVNSLAAEGFEAKELHEIIQELQAQNKKLEIKAAELQSLSSLRESQAQLGLVPEGEVTYLEAGDTAVALRQTQR